MSTVTNSSTSSEQSRVILNAADRFLQKLVLLAGVSVDAELSALFWFDKEADCLRVTHSCDKEGIGVESMELDSVEGMPGLLDSLRHLA